MRFTESGFDSLSVDELHAATDALDYTINAAKSRGLEPTIESIFLRGMLNITTRVQYEVPQHGLMPYLDSLGLALSEYRDSRVRLKPEQDMLNLSPAERQELHRQVAQRELAKMMLAEIDEQRGLTPFMDWLVSLNPEDFISWQPESQPPLGE